jgi:ATP-dependent Clp protease ATP-binding subunit ClpB
MAEDMSMRFDKFTLKAQECIQRAQQAADKYGHQQIEPEHLLRAILDQKEGVVPPLLGKIGANREHLLQGTDSLLERMASVSGAGAGQAYISPRTKSVLDRAFQEAEQMKDEYVSLEHILLAILEEKDGKAARILASSGITKEAILQALVDIRGGQRQVPGPGTLQPGPDRCGCKGEPGSRDREG